MFAGAGENLRREGLKRYRIVVGVGTATARIGPARPALGGRYDEDSGRGFRRLQIRVPITIEVPEGTSAMALEFRVPRGWDVTSISDGGQWDAIHRKVKWGPFFNQLSRTVTFTAHPRTPQPRLADFSGTVSFDGLNRPIEIDRCTRE